MKNKKNAEVTKTVFIRKFIFNFFMMNKDNRKEIIRNRIRLNLLFNSDFIHFNLGPIAIANKNGIKKGIINLL